MQPNARTLTFDWPIHHWFRSKIPLFFFVSALLHGCAFLLFQVVNREKVGIPYRSAFSISKVEPKEPERWNSLAVVPVPIFTVAVTRPKTPELSSFRGAVILASSLQARLSTPPELPETPDGKILENPEYLLGVEGSGSVQFVWLQKSSGDQAADQLGERVMRGLNFAGGEAQTAWGTARLLWKKLDAPGQ
ncbi:MAG: hypothetical protein EBR81_07740 [Proteobacteria bacterium]|nr:hypothetical protein [Pseudomonadota bacterium]